MQDSITWNLKEERKDKKWLLIMMNICVWKKCLRYGAGAAVMA
ncbi:hypothetical protein [Helicobacter saguini]|nr:hypothetical protein [Helicobacter saguini]